MALSLTIASKVIAIGRTYDVKFIPVENADYLHMMEKLYTFQMPILRKAWEHFEECTFGAIHIIKWLQFRSVMIPVSKFYYK